MKTMIKYLLVFILGFGLYSCSEGELTLEQLAAESVEFEKQRISPSTREFTVMIPKSWDWKNEELPWCRFPEIKIPPSHATPQCK